MPRNTAAPGSRSCGRRFGLSRVVLVGDRGMLTYYVEWHMRKALARSLFDDEELNEQRKNRGPVARAKQSASAKRKKTSRRTPQRFPPCAQLRDVDEGVRDPPPEPLQDKIGPPVSDTPAAHRSDSTSSASLQLLGLYPVEGN